MIKRNIFLTVLLLFFTVFSQLIAQKAPELQQLPIDPKLRYGKLSNGLTYYIRHNTQPKHRADFYIVQNVGSILEEDNQRGLAHFLEHMAFNGSKHFPNNGMDKYIESVGMRSAENFNAYTSFDETVYMITNAPVNKSGVTDSCLLILHDWSRFLSLTDSAIQKERSVIHEEWRTRQDAQSRLLEQQLPKIYPGSRYANRLPIGSIDVIDNFKPKELRDYYKKWYRPDLQGIIIVGDININQVETTIKQMFSDIPAPVNPTKREQIIVPDNKEPLISIAKDKESTNTLLFLFYKHDQLPKEMKGSITEMAKNYIQQICSSIMYDRFDEILHQANPPFIYAQAYDSDNFMIANSKGAWQVAAQVKENDIDSALITLVKEMKRIKQYGFTASEYERARSFVLKMMESAYNERDNEKNSAFVNEYIDHFINGGYIPGIEMEYSLMTQIAPNISLAQVNQYIQNVIGDDNIVISLTGPDKNGIKYPTEKQLLQTFLKAQQIVVEPYQDVISNEPLIPQLPNPGKIIENKKDTRFGTTILTLSNGVKVVLKPTDFKKDEILLTATSPGGSTLFNAKEANNLKLFDNVIALGGLGNFSSTELNKRLTGKIASCKLSLGTNSENINGMAAPSDLKTLFELIYLNFTAPRKDNEAYTSFITRLKAQLQNNELDPMVAFSDTLTAMAYGNHPRAKRLHIKDLNDIDYNHIMEMRNERFSDASDFTFTFVGNLHIDSICPLIEQYLATLPTLKRIEKGNVKQLPRIQKGEIINHFTHTMETPKASICNIYSGMMEYNLENLVIATALKQILDLTYFENIREKEGGSYSIGVSTGISSFPKGSTTLQIFFDTDPAKWQQMNDIIQKELKQIAKSGPKNEDFTKTKENMLKRHTETIQENSYWLNILDTYYFYNIDLCTDYEKVVRKITPAKIKAFAQNLLKQNNHIEISMRPE